LQRQHQLVFVHGGAPQQDTKARPEKCQGTTPPKTELLVIQSKGGALMKMFATCYQRHKTQHSFLATCSQVKAAVVNLGSECLSKLALLTLSGLDPYWQALHF
jgi:hypothetical protein